jgi:hypothetical protein
LISLFVPFWQEGGFHGSAFNHKQKLNQNLQIKKIRQLIGNITLLVPVITGRSSG